VEWVGLVFAWGTSEACVFQGTQLGYIDSRIAISTRRYNLASIYHRSKNWNMKEGEKILIAQPLLESSKCAYLEWLVNEVK
jgi:hypothetical protein